MKYYHIIMLSQSWKQLKLWKAKHKQLQMGQSIQEWIQVIQWIQVKFAENGLSETLVMA